MSNFMRPSFNPSMSQNSLKKSNSTAGEARLLALEQKEENGLSACIHTQSVKPLHKCRTTVAFVIFHRTTQPRNLVFPKDVFVHSCPRKSKTSQRQFTSCIIYFTSPLFIQISWYCRYNTYWLEYTKGVRREGSSSLTESLLCLILPARQTNRRPFQDDLTKL